MPVAQRGRSLVAELILAGKARQLKSSALLWIATILWTDIEMATSQPTREEQPSVERALEQIEGIEVEAEGDGDPLEGLGNQQITRFTTNSRLRTDNCSGSLKLFISFTMTSMVTMPPVISSQGESFRRCFPGSLQMTPR